MRHFFLQKSYEKMVERQVLELFLFFEKVLYEVIESDQRPSFYDLCTEEPDMCVHFSFMFGPAGLRLSS